MNEEWHRPVPLESGQLPEFPVQALPDQLRYFAENLAESYQVPVDLPAMLQLTAVGASMSKRFEICLNPDWRQHLNLYVVVTLPPASRKSPIFSEIFRPFREYENQLIKLRQPHIEEVNRKRKTLESRIKKLEQKRDQLAPNETIDVTKQINELHAKIPKKIYAPTLIVDDVTSEKLTNIMAVNHGKLALLSPEGGIFNTINGRYSKQPNMEVYLKAHSGEDIRVDRISRGSDKVISPVLTLGLTVQPCILEEITSDYHFRNRGLLGRILYSKPDSKVGYRLVETPPVNQPTRNLYNKLIHTLAAHSFDGKGSYCKQQNSIYLSREAYCLFIEFQEELESELALGGRLSTIPDWAGKLAGQTGRIAGLLHGVANPNAPHITPVSEDTMKDSILIAHYLIHHALHILDPVEKHQNITIGTKILAWIKFNRHKFFSLRQVHQSLRGGDISHEQVINALIFLENRHYIKKYEQKDILTKGRPSTQFLVNPLFLNN